VETDGKIMEAMIVSKGTVLARHKGSEAIYVSEPEEKRIALQSEIIVSIAKTNERLFGDVGYVAINHRSNDAVLFGLGTNVLIVPIVRPYDLNKLVENVSDLLKKWEI
jgi:hypothetical protein